MPLSVDSCTSHFTDKIEAIRMSSPYQGTWHLYVPCPLLVTMEGPILFVKANSHLHILNNISFCLLFKLVPLTFHFHIFRFFLFFQLGLKTQFDHVNGAERQEESKCASIHHFYLVPTTLWHGLLFPESVLSSFLEF